MEDSHLEKHLLKVFSELEHRIAQQVIASLPDVPNVTMQIANEKLLKDVELCELFQISTSHFYKLKQKYKGFPTHSIGGSKRYKQSEIEAFFKTINS